MGYSGMPLIFKYDKKEQEELVFSRLISLINGKVIDHKVVNSVLYAAVEFPGEGVSAVIVPYEMVKRGREYELLYNIMSETVGPVERKCPLKILNLLDPTEHEYAKNWRDRCKENASIKNNRIPRKFYCITGKMLIDTNISSIGDIVKVFKDASGYHVLNTRTNKRAWGNLSILRNPQLFEFLNVV